MGKYDDEEFDIQLTDDAPIALKPYNQSVADGLFAR